MSEATDNPLPLQAAPPKKTNPWVIALVVLVMLCCCCIGVIGLIFGFWDPIQETLKSLDLYTLLPLVVLP
jgi:hypothetical protein